MCAPQGVWSPEVELEVLCHGSSPTRSNTVLFYFRFHVRFIRADNIFFNLKNARWKRAIAGGERADGA